MRAIQEAEFEEMILNLQEKDMTIINSNFSSFEVESAICLKAEKNEVQCERGPLMPSFLTDEPKRKINVKLGKKLKFSKWRDRRKILIVSKYPHEFN